MASGTPARWAREERIDGGHREGVRLSEAGSGRELGVMIPAFLGGYKYLWGSVHATAADGKDGTGEGKHVSFLRRVSCLALYRKRSDITL